MVFTFEGVAPPEKTPRVDEKRLATVVIADVASPKSVAFPVVAIVMNSITLVILSPDLSSPQNIALVELDALPFPLPFFDH